MARQGSGDRSSSKRVTLKDVGAHAGVSAITVSRCLNTPEQVSPQLRELVDRSVAALGYIPNQFARALASSRSHIVGVAIPSLTNTVFTDVLAGITRVMEAAGMRVLIADTGYDPAQEEKMLRTFLSQSPEALIITGANQSASLRQLIENAAIPVVQIMELVDDPIDMNVGFSHSAAGRDVAKHLLEQSTGPVGMIGARMDSRAQQRKDGFCKALKRAQRFDADYIVTTNEGSSIAQGGELLKHLQLHLTQCGKPAIQALFCTNDDLALGALFEAQRQGLRVPEDLAICGFNDIEAATYVNPSLSSVAVGRYDMGVSAAQMVLRAIKGESIASKIVKTPYSVCVRQSSAT